MTAYSSPPPTSSNIFPFFYVVCLSCASIYIHIRAREHANCCVLHAYVMCDADSFSSITIRVFRLSIDLLKKGILRSILSFNRVLDSTVALNFLGTSRNFRFICSSFEINEHFGRYCRRGIVRKIHIFLKNFRETLHFSQFLLHAYLNIPTG